MRSAGVRIVNAALLLVPVLLALLDGVAARGEDLGVWGALFAAACFALAMRELWSSPPPPEHHASPEQREAVRRAVEAAFKPDGD